MLLYVAHMATTGMKELINRRDNLKICLFTGTKYRVRTFGY